MPVPRSAWQTCPGCHLALEAAAMLRGVGLGLAEGFRSLLSPNSLVWVGLHLLWGKAVL